MKNTKFTYLCLIAVLILTACSSDDINDGGTDASIVGTWTGVSSSLNGYDFGLPDNNIVKFTSDNRTEFIYKGFGPNREDDSQFGNWTRNGNILVIEWDGNKIRSGTYILTITELTDSSLKWETETRDEDTLKETFEN